MINPLDQYCKLVKTNTGAHSIREAATRAQVFLFCDKHNSPKYQEANARAFDYLWRADAKFFTEASLDDHIPSSRLVHSVEVWQDTDVVDKMFEEIEDAKSLLLESSDVLFSFLKVVGSLYQSISANEGKASSSVASEVDPKKMRALLNNIGLLKKSSIFASLAFPERLDVTEIDLLLKSLAEEWCNYKTTMTERINQLIDEAAILRNAMLASSLIKAHKEGTQRIVAVAGSDHLRLPKKANVSQAVLTSIQSLYDALEKAEIPYLTLKATNKNLLPSSEELVFATQDPHVQETKRSTPINFLHRMKAIQLDVRDIFESDSVSAIYVTQQIEEISIAIIEPLLRSGIRIFEDSLEEPSKKKIKTPNNGSNQ